jgi:RNA polymerase sigma factor (sigma-70 family)
VTTPAFPRTDAELIARTRTGDMAAYDELYRRHVDGAQRVAQVVTGNAEEAQDVVSEAFTRVLDRLQRGGGPDDELSPYLNTVVRRLAIDRYQASQREGLPADPTLFDVMPEVDDPISRSTDRELVRRAFETLPERWQHVLWHTEIEGRSPAALAPSLGSTPNAVAALAYRAREGLRHAYLSVHLSADIPEDCRPYVPKLAAYVRGTLSPREDQWVAAHLEQCPHCRDRRDELMLLVADLRSVLWPALLLPVVLGGTKTVAAATAVAAAGATGAKAGIAAAEADGTKAGTAGTAGGTAGTTGAAVGVAGAAAGLGAAVAAAGSGTAGSAGPKPTSLAGQIGTGVAAVAAVTAAIVATAVLASDDEPPRREDSTLAAPLDPGQVGPPASIPRPSPTSASTPSPSLPSTVLPPVGRPPAAPVVDPPIEAAPAGVGGTPDFSSVAPAAATPTTAPATPAPSSVSSAATSSAGPSGTSTASPPTDPTTPTETTPTTPTDTPTTPTDTPTTPADTPTTPADTPTTPADPTTPTDTPTTPTPGEPPIPTDTPPPPDAPPWWWRLWCLLFPWWPGC